MSEERLSLDIIKLKRLTNGEIPPFYQDIENVLDKLDLYKSVIDEVREEVKQANETHNINPNYASQLFKILDKVKGSDK